MEVSDLITIDPEILDGTPVFKGTRVPVKTLFDYLEDNYSLEEFLECFPSVTREMACRVLERSEAVRRAVDRFLRKSSASDLRSFSGASKTRGNISRHVAKLRREWRQRG